MTKSTVFSAIQPSGELGLGHYLGAIQHWVALQGQHQCWFAVADLHAITVPQKPSELRQRSLDMVAYYLACGVDPEVSTIFIQSHVREHSQLSWLLSTLATMGELNRMTQYKDKSQNENKSIQLGLFAYPVLMAADVLLYQTNFVPVGEDQKQHLELTRDLAMRFNKQFGDVFTVPEPIINKLGARLMSLQDPTKKMSKSDVNVNNYIAFSDPVDKLVKKIKRAVTDSEATIQYDVNRPGISNLLTLFSCLTGESISQLEQRYQGAGYGVFKSDLAEVVTECVVSIQNKFNALQSDPQYLSSVLKKGSEKASLRAAKTLAHAYQSMGII
ncbi:MAG TPA: tryptophan--tRNA ligase [Gammaproteobacteria bacterium]|nr:tryptophan--tRNA ligase [Gammaproteobacteria bacterium]